MKYIHIGFPKNYSTSLQRSFFPAHPQLLHLGVGSRENNLGYHDEIVESTLELYIKSCKATKYSENREEIESHFRQLFDTALGQPGIKGVGISCEHLSFAFTMDGLDFVEKAKRIAGVFGEDTKVFMIVRNQRDLLKSMFRESLRQGLRMTYAEFLEFIYKFQDRNFFYDFCFSEVFDAYAEHFGKENVRIFFFEHYRTSGASGGKESTGRSLTDEISEFLGIDRMKEVQLGHFNEALNDYELQALHEFNQTHTHDLGNNLYETAEQHRSKSYFLKELGLNYAEHEFYKDVLVKREGVAYAKAHPASEPISFAANPVIESKIFDHYRRSNERLAQITRTIPSEYSL